MTKISTTDPIFYEDSQCQRTRYKCPQCRYLMRNAVQIVSCGHWLCDDCADSLFKTSLMPVCPTHGCHQKILGEKKFFPDMAVRKEIDEFRVQCRSSKCSWTGKFKEFPGHIGNCQELLPCPLIEGNHSENTALNCPFVEFGCQTKRKLTKNELDDHLAEETVAHSRLLVAVLSEIEQQQKVSSPAQITRLILLPHNERGIPKYRDIQAVANHIRYLQEEIDQLNSIGAASPYLNSDDLFKGQPTASDQPHPRQPQHESRFVLPSSSQQANHGASEFEFVWRIPEFSQRRHDTANNFICSPPFYVDRYKMCLRLYILGDGIGKGTHMSLFFVLMKGEFDNILQWPFNHKVTFKLINQRGGRDVVDVFQPDPLSSSFQRPITDMNIASGSPRFVSHLELMRGFVLDDAILIKVNVETVVYFNY